MKYLLIILLQISQPQPFNNNPIHPLYILNGEKMKVNNNKLYIFDIIPIKFISNIKVLTSTDEIRQYGEQGKNGVILIETFIDNKELRKKYPMLFKNKN